MRSDVATESLAIARVPRRALLSTLAVLYITQGLPFGLASEYLPVILRQAHYGLGAIAAVGWLQLPWQLKIFWARMADRSPYRERSREILLGVQLTLACFIGLYAPFAFRAAPRIWFTLTALCALVAATQDIFVDALAVRSLAPSDLGYGNMAQVAGYRLGMLAGGAGLLLLTDVWGQRSTLLVAALTVASAGAVAFALLGDPRFTVLPAAYRTASESRATPLGLWGVFKHMFAREGRTVIFMVATFKLGVHIAAPLIKPMVVDAHWTMTQIGVAVVTLGIVCGVTGALSGGVLYRALSEPRALVVCACLHAVTCAVLALAARLHVPRGLTMVAIGTEHFASGVGTTVLFAALMTATRRSSAALHYTVLTTANALVLGLGGQLGGFLGDRFGFTTTYTIAALICVLPLAFVADWSRAAAWSAAEPEGERA